MPTIGDFEICGKFNLLYKIKTFILMKCNYFFIILLSCPDVVCDEAAKSVDFNLGMCK